MRRTITALVLAAFIGSLFATIAFAATSTTSKPTAKKVIATKKPIAKTATTKPMAKTEKGLKKGLTKATKFVKRTVTVPQKNPKARKPNPNRKDSNLVKGVKTSAHKADKWIKGRTKIE